MHNYVLIFFLIFKYHINKINISHTYSRNYCFQCFLWDLKKQKDIEKAAPFVIKKSLKNLKFFFFAMKERNIVKCLSCCWLLQLRKHLSLLFDKVSQDVLSFRNECFASFLNRSTAFQNSQEYLMYRSLTVFQCKKKKTEKLF